MPSFDIVSEVDSHELTNAIDQANREINNRHDFKGTNAGIAHSGETLTLEAAEEFQIKQMLPIVHERLAKRGIDIGCLEAGKIESSGTRARQEVTIRQGIDSDRARKIVKLIKNSKLKVQAAIQGEQVRVSGKKRDDLQSVIATLKQAELGLPLQFTNFRD
jgi:uncharacterized protein YajQ (UPF0234 family)